MKSIYGKGCDEESLVNHNYPVKIDRPHFLVLFTSLVISLILMLMAYAPSVFCAEPKPLKIGVLQPLTGVMAGQARHEIRGMSVFYEQNGWKVAGRPIVLIEEDTEFNPQVGLRKARKLVEQDQVDLLVGVMSSAIGSAMKEYCTRAKIVWITNACFADPIFRKSNFSPYAFRITGSCYQFAWPMGDWLAKKGYKRLFVTGPDYSMGHEMSEACKKGWQNAGGPPPTGEVHAPTGTPDYAPYLAQIKKAEPDCMFASFAGTDAVRFVKQFDEFGLKKSIQLSGMGYTVSEESIPGQGESALGLYSSATEVLDLDIPENKAFVEYYRKKFNAYPTGSDYSAYNSAMLVYEAVKKLNGDTSDQLALAKTIQGLKLVSPRGPFRFDPVTNNVIENVYIREARKVGGEITNYLVDTYKDVIHPHE